MMTVQISCFGNIIWFLWTFFSTSKNSSIFILNIITLISYKINTSYGFLMLKLHFGMKKIKYTLFVQITVQDGEKIWGFPSHFMWHVKYVVCTTIKTQTTRLNFAFRYILYDDVLFIYLFHFWHLLEKNKKTIFAYLKWTPKLTLNFKFVKYVR